MQIAAVELDDAGAGDGEGGHHARGVDAARHLVAGRLRAQRDLLPGGVDRPGRLLRGSARKAPAPGRVVTSPSAASSASARETVTGLTRCRSTSARLEGSFSPGE